MSTKAAGASAKSAIMVAPKQSATKSSNGNGKESGKMHRRSRSGMPYFLGHTHAQSLTWTLRMLHMSPSTKEVRRGQRTMQSMQTSGPVLRVQETDMVEQRRATKADEGDHQEHHQAHKDKRKSCPAGGVGPDGRRYSSRLIAFVADISNVLSHSTHASTF